MQLRTAIFLTFIVLLVCHQKVSAFEPFVKHVNNPLSISANYPNWIEKAKYQPTVMYDNGEYKLYYASYTGSQFKIAYATSSDGINFVGQKLLDVYPGFDNHDPSILKTQNGYTLFFVASTNGGTQNFKIYRIDSYDGINFDPNSRQLVIQPANVLETKGTSSPSVFYSNNTFYLFYLCWSNSGFKVCLATSTDGINWNRCPNNPIINQTSDGPSIFEKSGSFYLFFHGNGGIHQIESKDTLSCSMTWENDHVILTPGPQAYDGNGIISPSIIDLTNKLYLYYSGAQTVWTINLAISDLKSLKKPIIFLPGLLGSWNKEAILHNKTVGIYDWKITPIAKEYQGIEQTLNNLGYEMGKDLFLFPYDWRKGVDLIAADLDDFYHNVVEPKINGKKINLVGHSLGGLTARIYGQRSQIEHINKIITIGSPHQGVAQVYKAVEGGEFDKSDKLQWLAQKIILQLNKNKIKTDKQTINEKMPVLKDLFPIYNFLYDQNNNEIDISTMLIENNTLKNYHSSLSTIFPKLQTIVGEKIDTISGYQIGPKTILDYLLDLYPDGRPVASKYEVGDNTVISKSAKADTDFIILPLDHGEIVFKSDGIKELLTNLDIPFQNNQIVEGDSTKIFPSLVFLILSPATMEVRFNGQIFPEQEGIILIENAQPGEYMLKITGKDFGSYQVIVGQVGNNSDTWSTIDGKISQNPPSSQQDTYIVSFDPNNLSYFPINQFNISSLFDLLMLKIHKINSEDSLRVLDQAYDSLKSAKENYLLLDGSALRRDLLSAHRKLFQSITKSSAETDEHIFDAVIELENLYDKSLQTFQPKPSYTFLSNELERYKRSLDSLEQSLLQKKLRGDNVIEQTNLFILAKDKIHKAEETFQQQNLDYTEILLKSVKELL